MKYKLLVPIFFRFALVFMGVLSLPIFCFAQNVPNPNSQNPFDYSKENLKTIQKDNQQPTNSVTGTGSVKPGDIGQTQKRGGVPRIGIVTTISKVPEEQDEALRLHIYEMLYGNRPTSSVDAVLLREKLDRNILQEAKQMGVDLVLYLSLESTIKSVNDQSAGGKRLGGIISVIKDATGIGNSPDYGKVFRETYKAYRVLDSLQNSTELLNMIEKVTKNKDKISLKYRMFSTADGSLIIPESISDRTAQKKQEPVFRNLLVEVGNKILNAIPENITISAKPSELPMNQPQSPGKTPNVPLLTGGITTTSRVSSSGVKPVEGQTCLTPTSQAPAIRGIKLGMSRQQVDAVFQAADIPADSEALRFGEVRCWDKAAGGCVYFMWFSASELRSNRVTAAFPMAVASGPLKDVTRIRLEFFNGKVIKITSYYLHPALGESLRNTDYNTSKFIDKQVRDSLGLVGSWKGDLLQCSGFLARTSVSSDPRNNIEISLRDSDAEKEIMQREIEFKKRANKIAEDKSVTFKP